MINLENLDLDKMEGTKLGTPKFKKFSEAEVGEVLVTGIYLGSYPNKFNADKPNHKFEIKGRQLIVVPAAGQLDFLIKESVEIGDLVRVTYMGKEELSQGKFAGRPVNCFDVELLMEGDRAVKREAAPVEAKAVEPTDADLLD